MSYVEIENINKSFADVKVLNNINFSINKGELLTLLGPSGCGKSTLLRCIAGLHDFESGRIIIDHREVNEVKPRDREVGMVFQSYALFPNMTVYENIAFGLKMKKIYKDLIDKKVREMINIVDLNGKENSSISQLSGGQQQRVALARAIVTEPKVLLLDEPLSALDAKIRKNLQKQIRDIQKKLNMTTIFVTHDQEEAMTISDRIIVMNKGNIAQIGTPDEIYRKPKDMFVANFIGSYNVLSKEEATSLIDRKFTSDIAIRPEVMSIMEAGNQYGRDSFMFEAEIKNKFMKGSVIRYELNKNGIKTSIDLLNNNSLNYNEGDKIKIAIPKNDVIYFNDNA